MIHYVGDADNGMSGNLPLYFVKNTSACTKCNCMCNGTKFIPPLASTMVSKFKMCRICAIRIYSNIPAAFKASFTHSGTCLCLPSTEKCFPTKFLTKVGNSFFRMEFLMRATKRIM